VLALTKRSAKAFKLEGGGHTGKKPAVLIGQRKALGMAVGNNRTENRFLGFWRGFRELPKNLRFLAQNLRKVSVNMCTKTCTKMIRTD
jgi:hypothetical protein